MEKNQYWNTTEFNLILKFVGERRLAFRKQMICPYFVKGRDTNTNVVKEDYSAIEHNWLKPPGVQNSQVEGRIASENHNSYSNW